MEVFGVLWMNDQGQYGRWAFSGSTDVYEMQDDFREKVKNEFTIIELLVVHGQQRGID